MEYLPRIPIFQPSLHSPTENVLTRKVAYRRLKCPHVGGRLSGLLSGPYRHTYDTG